MSLLPVSFFSLPMLKTTLSFTEVASIKIEGRREWGREKMSQQLWWEQSVYNHNITCIIHNPFKFTIYKPYRSLHLPVPTNQKRAFNKLAAGCIKLTFILCRMCSLGKEDVQLETKESGLNTSPTTQAKLNALQP